MKRSSASNWWASMVRKWPAWYSRRSFPVKSSRVLVSGVSWMASATITSSSLIRLRGAFMSIGSPCQRSALCADTPATPLVVSPWIRMDQVSARANPEGSHGVSPCARGTGVWAPQGQYIRVAFCTRVRMDRASSRCNAHRQALARSTSAKGVRTSQLWRSIKNGRHGVVDPDGCDRGTRARTYRADVLRTPRYGIKAARTAYYGCPVSVLTTAQAAFLVGLVQNPTGLNPLAHPDLAAKRRQYILNSLADAGVISEAEEAKPAAENAESIIVMPKAAACP